MTSLRSRLLAVAVSLLLPCAAYAQLSVYGDAALTAYGFDTSSAASFKSDSGGLMVGGFYNFPIQSRLTAGIDLRTSYSPGSRGGNFTAAALRIGLVPHHVPLRPFFQIGGGVVSTTGDTTTVTLNPKLGYIVTTTNQRYTNGAVEISFGLDVRLTDHFDLRALDYGAVAGASNNSTAAAGAYLGAGVVYHLRPGGH